VLPREGDTVTEREVALLAAEAPQDATAAPIDLVDGPGVARRHEQVAVFGEVDGVDVEVVVGARRWQRLVALVERDVIEAMPLEEDPASGDVELLDDAVQDLAVLRAADGGQIARNGVLDRDERGALGRQAEFVLVRVEPIAGAEGAKLAVDDVVDAFAVPAEFPRPQVSDGAPATR
jgi:hypothetical protein